MGRRKLVPNINNLLLQLHLPHRHSHGGKTNESNGVAEESSPKEDTHSQNTQHHIFTWPSLKKNPSSLSLASVSSEDDIDTDHETEPPISDRTHGDLQSASRIIVNNSNNNDSLHSSGHKSVVSFGNCEIRTYTQVLGDHPCCSEGCPIQLGWSYTSEESIKVDDYERVYHTIEESDGCCQQKYTHLHDLRLSPEVRRSILIVAKQQEYVNANVNTIVNANDAPCENDCTSSSNDETIDHGDSDCALLSDCDDKILSASAIATVSQSPSDHERELRRECRRLHRCGGWNINVKASRKRNKRTQEAFFGSPTTTTKTIQRIPLENITTPIEL